MNLNDSSSDRKTWYSSPKRFLPSQRQEMVLGLEWVSVERVGEPFGALSFAFDVNFAKWADLAKRTNVGSSTRTNVHLLADSDDAHLLN